MCYIVTSEDAPVLRDFQEFLDEYFDVCAKEWLENDNILLTDNRGNFAAFENQKEGIFRGHYFFKDRGKEAIAASTEFLKEVFNIESVKTIVGLTPISHLGARWLSKKIGFSTQGVIHTEIGPCELFSLTRREWENR